MKILNHLNLAKNELQNAVIQNLASAPSSPVEGQQYYDTTLHQFGVYQNSTWTYLAAASANGVTRSGNAGASGELITSAGTDKTIQSFTTNGLVKIASGTVAAAVAGTDYVTGASTNTLTNKTFDAQGTGNALSNVTTSNFASNVIDTDTTLAANSDTRLSSQKAIKAYVDAIQQGIKWKQSVRAATTANGTLASAYANSSVIDGVTLATGDRILLKDQTAGTENGIYIVAASGAPTRTIDADTGVEIKQAAVFVEEGTTNVDNAYVCTNNGTITLGSTSLVFVSFSSATVPTATSAIAGKVILASQAEAEAKSDTAKAIVSADLVNFPIKKIFTIGDGAATSIACTHSLGTQDVVVSIRDAGTNAAVETDWTATSTNVVTFIFASAPASNAYKVVIIG